MTDETMEPSEAVDAPEPVDEKADLTPTSAAEWPVNKSPQGVTVELPSGAIATLRRPPLQYYIATGRVHPKLWIRVQEVGALLFADPVNTMTREELDLFVDWMIAESFVSPKVSLTRRKGSVWIGDLCDEDKEEVMDLLGLSLAG